MKIKRSAFQIELEKDGWTFYTNVLVGQFGEPKTEEHLVFEYMHTKRFKDVLIAETAFDCEGQQLTNPDYRAVYVK